MSTDANKAIIRRLYDELFVQWKLDVIDELFSPDFVDHGAAPDTPPGPKQIHRVYAALRAAYPGMQLLTEDIIGEGDNVAIRWTGNDQLPARGMVLYRLRDGKIIERWVHVVLLDH